MITKPLNKRIDHILEVLYDASDVPHIHRKYVGAFFEGDVEGMIERSVIDNMDKHHDHTEDIRDLEDRIGKIEDAIRALTRAFKDV